MAAVSATNVPRMSAPGSIHHSPELVSSHHPLAVGVYNAECFVKDSVIAIRSCNQRVSKHSILHSVAVYQLTRSELAEGGTVHLLLSTIPRVDCRMIA